MLFNVSGLIQDGIGATREHAVRGTLTSEERGPEQVSGTVELLRTKAGVLVRAHMSLVEPEVCSRCVKPLEETLDISFEEEFLTTVDPRSGLTVREPLDPDAFKINEHNMIDITEAVRQYREASAVMAPLCRPDCRGLCPNCGSDLNLGDCGCEANVTENPWARLAELLPQQPTRDEGRDDRPTNVRRVKTSRRGSNANLAASKGKD